MNTYVILLRGVNVGGKNKLPMAALRELMLDHGYCRVRTYIQSGNIVASSESSPPPALCSIVQAAFGFTPAVLVMTRDDYLQAIAENPFADENGKSIHLFFSAQPCRPDLPRMERLQSTSERFQLGDKLCFLYAPDGIGRSKLAAAMESCLGVATTARNLNTVAKLREMLLEA